MPYLTRSGDVWELYLGTEGHELDPDNPENRFSSAWITGLETALEQIESAATGALVITATGKFFSNGLELAELSDPSGLDAYIDRVHGLYARMLTLPVATVAAINGHAFGAGAMLALCADHRVMRTERGFWSLPEVALGMPFPDGMASLLAERLPESTRTEAMTTSRRYGSDDAVAAGVVEEAVAVDDLLTHAREVAQARAGHAGANLAAVKRSMRRAVLADLAPTATR
ncbi:enoyl-CoA hydratase/isomerase family protein [uncultured Williamsia sp.]|uniref:enoyl-CoA hydratase/isomerase family protein n=1 Tax=uncultured Williamsia sp. TaxID=259311 RepID=UPI0026245923|nr:enoyl-CoA hydratase/isomerase family protein [uncultured Williamsia sp.]